MAPGTSHEYKTLVLTDIEGSTTHWERDPSVMGAAIARHDEIVRREVEAAGGRLVKHKGEGDSTFSAFDGADAAVSAALGLQRAVTAETWPTVEPIRVRIGIHTGEVEARDGDFFGRTVNRAARVRGLAAAATIVATATTIGDLRAALPDNTVLIDLGVHALKGLPDAERLYAIGHPALPDADSALDYLRHRADSPIPAALRGYAETQLVGRARELAALDRSWSAAMGRRASLALVSGEPGVGKTRLAAALAQHAVSMGAAVLYGRCDEDPPRSYQPLAEALSGAIERLSPYEADALAGDLAADLALFLPELRTRFARPGEPASERFLFFRSIATVMERLAAERPVLLVLDDLHWADEPSLALLHHVLRQVADSRMMVLATYRGGEAVEGSSLVRSLVELRRCAPSLDVEVRGLDHSAVAELLGDAHRARLEAIWSATDGNPFFVLELRRGLEEGSDAIPHSIRQSIAARIARFPEGTQAFVRAAAIAGIEVEVSVAAKAAGGGEHDAGAAVAGGILAETPEDARHLRFAHALVRSSVLADMPAVTRSEIHRRVAGAIEAFHGHRLDDQAARLAHHYFQAGDAGPAYQWSMRAGRRAGQILAYEEAEQHYRTATQVAELDGDAARTARAELELAEVLERAGRPATATAMAEAAGRKATDIGEMELAAWAVFSTRFAQALGIPVHLEALRWARASVHPSSVWCGPLDVVLAAEMIQSGEVDAGIDLLNLTESRARADEDWTLLALALTGRHMFVDRLEPGTRDILEVIGRIGDSAAPSLRLSAPVLRVQTESLRIGELVTGGDVVQARQTAKAFAARYGSDTGITEANVPLFGMTDALLSGRWDAWQQQTARFRSDPELAVAFGSQLLGTDMMAAWLKGGLPEAAALIEAMPRTMMFVRPGLAIAYAQGQRPHDVRRVIQDCAANNGLAARALSVSGRAELAILAYALPITGDVATAERIYQLLVPRRGQIAAWAGWAFWGAVDSVLGVLAAMCGRAHQAIEHLEAAHTLYDRAGWRVLAAMNAVELASALVDRGRPDDKARAASLIKEASCMARKAELGPVQDRVSDVTARIAAG